MFCRVATPANSEDVRRFHGGISSIAMNVIIQLVMPMAMGTGVSVRKSFP